MARLVPADPPAAYRYFQVLHVKVAHNTCENPHVKGRALYVRIYGITCSVKIITLHITICYPLISLHPPTVSAPNEPCLMTSGLCTGVRSNSANQRGAQVHVKPYVKCPLGGH